MLIISGSNQEHFKFLSSVTRKTVGTMRIVAFFCAGWWYWEVEGSFLWPFRDPACFSYFSRLSSDRTKFVKAARSHIQEACGNSATALAFSCTLRTRVSNRNVLGCLFTHIFNLCWLIDSVVFEMVWIYSLQWNPGFTTLPHVRSIFLEMHVRWAKALQFFLSSKAYYCSTPTNTTTSEHAPPSSGIDTEWSSLNWSSKMLWMLFIDYHVSHASVQGDEAFDRTLASLWCEFG